MVRGSDWFDCAVIDFLVCVNGIGLASSRQSSTDISSELEFTSDQGGPESPNRVES
jgi:hypothetical protein